jgi:two-component system, response regulator PdtaR
MPRHFFDLENGETRYVDTEGTELADAGMIRDEATRFLASVFRDAVPEMANRSLVVRARDEAERIVFTATLTLEENWIGTVGVKPATGRRPLVLIVDDDPPARTNAVDIIQEAGFDVLEAGNADEAIAILATRPDVQVVFTEVSMPGSMDGLGLARHVRDKWPSMKIIATTGGFVIDEDELPEGGLFLQKPYTPDRVTSAIRKFTDKAN